MLSPGCGFLQESFQPVELLSSQEARASPCNSPSRAIFGSLFVPPSARRIPRSIVDACARGVSNALVATRLSVRASAWDMVPSALYLFFHPTRQGRWKRSWAVRSMLSSKNRKIKTTVEPKVISSTYDSAYRITLFLSYLYVIEAETSLISLSLPLTYTFCMYLHMMRVT